VVTSNPESYREHQHLVAEPVGDLSDQLGPPDRCGVHGDLVRAGPQQPVDVLDAADPATDRERDEHLLGSRTDDLHRRRATLVGGRDVEEGQLVGSLGVVQLGQLDRVAGVAQLLEVHALDHPAGVHVEAGDDAYGQTHVSSRVRASASSRVNRPS
jgi:hypothetical protein